MIMKAQNAENKFMKKNNFAKTKDKDLLQKKLLDMVKAELKAEKKLNVSGAQTSLLMEAFEIFNQKTHKLSNAYEILKKQIAQMNRELDKKNRQLEVKVSELNNTRTYLKNLLESVPSGVIAVGLDGGVTTFNSIAGSLTGISSPEIIGKNIFTDFVDNDQLFSVLKNTIRKGRPELIVEREITSISGKPLIVESRTSFVKDSKGNVTGAMEILHDRTCIKELEKQARKAEQLAVLGEMAANIAHEIRNPLGGIEGFAALLAREFEAEDSRKEMAVNIVDGARSLNNIVSSLLDFTKPVQIRRRVVSVKNILEQSLEFAFHGNGRPASFHRKNIKVCRDFDKSVQLYCDSEKMQQVFLNLILNAFQAMDWNGKIGLGIKKYDAYVKIEIADSGPGIPQEESQKLFTPFFTTKKNGTGLGLAMVQKIIDLHNGNISVSSPGSGGTKFIIKIPY